MRTACCFTPDRAFFVPAVRAIASLIEAELEVEREIFLLCAPDDVTPGFERLPSCSRERIKLMTLDFPRFDGQPRRRRCNGWSEDNPIAKAQAAMADSQPAIFDGSTSGQDTR